MPTEKEYCITPAWEVVYYEKADKLKPIKSMTE